MSNAFQEKERIIKKKFALLPSLEMRYNALIDLGKKLPPFPPSLKTPDNIVKGCQSTLYLYGSLENGKLFFQASSDALISAGLAALLLEVYNGEAPETLLSCPPDFLLELGVIAHLSPS